MPHLPGQPNVSTGSDGSQPLTARDANVRAHSAPPHAEPRLKFTGAQPAPVPPSKPTGGSTSNTANVAIMPDTDPWRPKRRKRVEPGTDD